MIHTSKPSRLYAVHAGGCQLAILLAGEPGDSENGSQPIDTLLPEIKAKHLLQNGGSW